MNHNSHPVKKIDFSSHVFTVNYNNELINAKTYEPTGQNKRKCMKIVEESEKDFEIAQDGKIISECDSSECKCVNALNASLDKYNNMLVDSDNVEASSNIYNI